MALFTLSERDNTMRDLTKLGQEIRKLEHIYGRDNVFWHKDYEWIGIYQWSLPPNLNRQNTIIVVVLPPHYGNGAPIIDSFIEPGLQAKDNNGNYNNIAHYFKEYKHNEADLTFGNSRLWSEKGYWWLCLQDLPGRIHTESICSYLNHVYIFFNEPFRDWIRTFNAYKEYA
jgi:hypothetical protein